MGRPDCHRVPRGEGKKKYYLRRAEPLDQSPVRGYTLGVYRPDRCTARRARDLLGDCLGHHADRAHSRVGLGRDVAAANEAFRQNGDQAAVDNHRSGRRSAIAAACAGYSSRTRAPGLTSVNLRRMEQVIRSAAPSPNYPDGWRPRHGRRPR